ncbi:BZ3500_MvSof-1268-A1-R1_Chr1-2g01485 [Microbotryum saponariae]|uniref:BZ3500_MvSof-1268-A1-R1_Chr1-2g01485 protein n=1 Tax=Microbotryum saponariae TaxID=289078 RepID=A0A2X0MHF7_9BASI|nr:BZ3500_MvSof-1268-A1-R1_Chr1-2g01485 [Microbotryum saponariae]
MNLLKELCRAHHVEGYSRSNPLAKELFLQALLWSCDPNCNACSNGVFGHNVRWVPEHHIKREESGIWKILTNSTLRTDLRPPTYDSSAWRGALIHPRRLHRPSDLIDQIAMNNTLQCSLWPDCFKRQFEHLVTVRARAYKIMYKLTRFGDRKAQQEFRRGNTLIFSQNTASFTDVLPIPNLAELDKCRPMIVKQSRIHCKRCSARSTQFRAPPHVIPTGDDPLWECSDDFLLSKLWPHLDPLGLVGVCVERDVKISLEEQVSHPSFPFIVSNILRRRDVFHHLAFRVPKEKVARIAAALLEIYRISTVFWRFVQARTYFNQARQAQHARFQFVPHRIRVHARNKPLFMQPCLPLLTDRPPSPKEKLSPVKRSITVALTLPLPKKKRKSLPEVPISQRQLKQLLIAKFGERAMWVPGADDHMHTQSWSRTRHGLWHGRCRVISTYAWTRRPLRGRVNEGRLVLHNFSKLLYKLYNAQIFFCGARRLRSRRARAPRAPPARPPTSLFKMKWTSIGSHLCIHVMVFGKVGGNAIKHTG